MWTALFTAFTGRVVGYVRELRPTTKMFIAGLLVGLVVSSLTCAIWPHPNQKDRIALENYKAAQDTTRKLSVGNNDTVFARLLYQANVDLGGAIATAARLRHDNLKLQTAVTLTGKPTNQREQHTVTSDSSGVRQDSLTLSGGSVVGVVGVRIRDSQFAWDARLRPAPIRLEAGVGCGKDGPEIFVKGPGWVTTDIGKGNIDPTICHPKPSRFGAGIRTGIVGTVGGYAIFRIAKSLLSKR